MLHRYRFITAIAAVPLLALALAACGGGNDNSTTSAANTASASTTAASTGGSTVSVQSIGGKSVLVDAKGDALYTNDQDTSSMIACTGQCTSFWPPLAAPTKGQPTSSDASVQGKLGSVKGSDGSSQVTFNGKPLYTFVQDSPGQVTGDGFSDSFGGTNFHWTVASTGGSSGAAAPAPAPTTTSSSSSSGGGGYGY